MAWTRQCLDGNVNSASNNWYILVTKFATMHTYNGFRATGMINSSLITVKVASCLPSMVKIASYVKGTFDV